MRFTREGSCDKRIKGLGWKQDFTDFEVSDTERRGRSPEGGPAETSSPLKIFKIEVFVNGISDILRPSKRVIMSHFFLI